MNCEDNNAPCRNLLYVLFISQAYPLIFCCKHNNRLPTQVTHSAPRAAREEVVGARQIRVPTDYDQERRYKIYLVGTDPDFVGSVQDG